MKTLYILISIALFFTTFVSCDNSPLEATTNQNLNILHGNTLFVGNGDTILINDITVCANNIYPSRVSGLQTFTQMTFKKCSNDNEHYITAIEAAYRWASHNQDWDDNLLFKACGKVSPTYLPAITNFSKLPGIHPNMKWNFMWAHYWIVERRIANGTFTQVYTYAPPNQPGSLTPPDTNWIDTSINLNTFNDIVVYRIKGKVWSEFSNTAPLIYWDNRINPDNMDF
jgi:hypothetical protein